VLFSVPASVAGLAASAACSARLPLSVLGAVYPSYLRPFFPVCSRSALPCFAVLLPVFTHEFAADTKKPQLRGFFPRIYGARERQKVNGGCPVGLSLHGRHRTLRCGEAWRDLALLTEVFPLTELHLRIRSGTALRGCREREAFASSSAFTTRRLRSWQKRVATLAKTPWKSAPSATGNDSMANGLLYTMSSLHCSGDIASPHSVSGLALNYRTLWSKVKLSSSSCPSTCAMRGVTMLAHSRPCARHTKEATLSVIRA